jgi:hypothetical protein
MNHDGQERFPRPPGRLENSFRFSLFLLVSTFELFLAAIRANN